MSNQPYIGLRPFERTETDIFFGREQHSDELINRLSSNHFLAVIGTSGCGKSSLVKTGLIAGLEAGFLAKAGTHWRIVEMRPSQQPFQVLAEKLLVELADVLTPDYNVKRLEQALRQGSLSLHELLAKYPLPNAAQLLIVCDQFEEIFRYFQQGESAQARNFVSLLLASSKPYPLSSLSVSHSLYVVITMRSDFLGECTQFAGLAEAINSGLYLTPRLDAQQLREAIEEPAFVCGGEVEPALVTQLLEDAGNNQDQLPLLQHVLMRLWDLSKDKVLTLADYENIGGLIRTGSPSKDCQSCANALSRHADEVYDGLRNEQKHIAEVLFRNLTESDNGKRDTRRPTRLAEIVELTGATFVEVVAVIDAFRQAGRCFLMPPINVALNSDSVIDISHESLIRQWQTLQHWVEDEAQAAELYRHLLESALRYRNKQVGLLQEPELSLMAQWRKTFQPTPAWAMRYGNDKEDFPRALAFLSQSTKRQRLKKVFYTLLFIAMTSSAGLASWQWKLADKHKKQAQEQQQLAVKQKDLAMAVISQFTYEVPEALANIPQTGRLTAEILEFNSAKLEEIYALNPDDKEAQRERASNFLRVGNLYLNLLGNVNKALDFYQQALKIDEQIAQADPNNSAAQRDLSVSLNNTGDIHLQLNQTDKALSFYNQSQKILEKIAQADPNNSAAQRDLSVSLEKLGNIHLQLNQTDKALSFYNQSLKIAEKIAQADPNNSAAQRDLSVSLEKLGDIHLQLNQTDKALSFYNQSLKIAEKIAQADPNNSAAQRDLSVSLNKLGNIHLQLNQTDKAWSFYNQSLKIAEKIAQADPNNSAAQRDLSVSLEKLGDIYLQLNQTDKALSFYSQALKISEQIAQADPNNSAAQRDLFVSFIKLGNVEKQRNNKAAAKQWFEKALPIAQKLAQDKMNVKAQQNLKTLLDEMKGL